MIKQLKKGERYRWEKNGSKFDVDIMGLSCTCGGNLHTDGCQHMRDVFGYLGICADKGIKTKNGYFLDEVVSALQKEIRRGNELEAGFWSLEMAESGYVRYLFNRLAIMTAEDIGLAHPEAINVVMSCRQLVEYKLTSTGSHYIPTEMIGFLILYLCRLPKNRVGDDFICYVQEMRQRGMKLLIPDYAIDQHTRRGKRINKEWAEQDCKSLQEIENIQFYQEGAIAKNYKKVPGEDWSKLYKELIGLNCPQEGIRATDA